MIGDDNVTSDDTPMPLIHGNSIYDNGSTHKGDDCPERYRVKEALIAAGFNPLPGWADETTAGDCGGGIGMRAQVPATVQIYANEIYNHIGTNQFGIGVQQSAHPTIGGNSYLYSNTIKNNYRGIGVRNNAHPTISYNDIYSNIRQGLALYEDSYPTISNNRIYSNQRNGISVTGNARTPDDKRPLIIRNKIYENGNPYGSATCPDEIGPGGTGNCGGGISNRADSNALISSNLIYNHLGTNNWGIGIRENASPKIYNENEIKNNYRGIGVRGYSKPHIENNYIASNLRHGIGNRDHSEAYIYNNSIRNNGLDFNLKTKPNGGGIGVQRQAHPTIEGNNIRNNPAGGIGCKDINTEPIIIKDNYISANNISGLRLQEGAYVVMSGNEVYDHEGTGDSGSGAIRLRGYVGEFASGSVGDQSDCAGSTCTSIQVHLGGAASTENDKYNGMVLIIPGADPSHMDIYDYDEPNQIAHISPAYKVRPSNGAGYTIMRSPLRVNPDAAKDDLIITGDFIEAEMFGTKTLGDQSAMGINQVKLPDTACGAHDCYNEMVLAIPNADPSWMKIYDYDKDTKIAYVSSPNPNAVGDPYSIVPKSGDGYSIVKRTRLPKSTVYFE